MTTLTPGEAESLVKRVASKLGYDYYGGSTFPKDRKDVCAAKYTSENGSTYGYDTIYLVWKDAKGEIQHSALINSRDTKDYIHIEEVVAEDNKVTVKVKSGGSYSGKPWEKSIAATI
jgi:hypothetical protein